MGGWVMSLRGMDCGSNSQPQYASHRPAGGTKRTRPSSPCPPSPCSPLPLPTHPLLPNRSPWLSTRRCTCGTPPAATSRSCCRPRATTTSPPSPGPPTASTWRWATPTASPRSGTPSAASPSATSTATPPASPRCPGTSTSCPPAAATPSSSTTTCACASTSPPRCAATSRRSAASSGRLTAPRWVVLRRECLGRCRGCLPARVLQLSTA